jgi:mono/diheme cytochrome c family protein
VKSKILQLLKAHELDIMDQQESVAFKAEKADPSLTEAMNALKRLQPAGTTPTESGRLIRQGKQVAEKSCGRCHAVGAKDVSRDKNATGFRNLSRRHSNLTLRAPIERAIAVTHDAMPPFNLRSVAPDF